MRLSKIELQDAQDWMLEMVSTTDEVEAVNDADDEAIENFVEKNFKGGISAWKALSGGESEK